MVPAQAGQRDIAGPPGSGAFGTSVTLLPNGNLVVTDPAYDTPEGVEDAGAVYLFDGATLKAVSVLTGSQPKDRVGSDGITVLTNGNFVVSSRLWNDGRGAVTWGSGTTGVSGRVSAANSLIVGADAERMGATSFGNNSVTALKNGNYVVRTPLWNWIRGAVTWGNGVSGTSGEISAINSLVGTRAYDNVGGQRNGDNGVVELNNGNYLVISGRWNLSRGAVTWASGASGVAGEVAPANSLTGSSAEDYVGDTKENYGSGSKGVTLLNNGNYVVVSRNWNGSCGAVTWGSGASGVAGEVSAANSLVGTSTIDQFLGTYIHELTNGNYVVRTPYALGGPGAVTWGSGTSGVKGTVSAANSLVGTRGAGRVGGGLTLLSNGNYVVVSHGWNSERGAATWGDGRSGVSGEVSAANSLVGASAGDIVGWSGVTALSNGHYVVSSSGWSGGRGAVTWGDGMSGTAGEVSAANSLTGSAENDTVGANVTGNQTLESGVTALANGNFVVRSPLWNNRRGAVTWRSGNSPGPAVVSEMNSLVGLSAEDKIGYSGVQALPNGNYVVVSPNWNERRGAATWGNGTLGKTGSISAGNSLIGGHAGDEVGANVDSSSERVSGVTVLKNGNYVVSSIRWNENRGAVTWGSGFSGVSGEVSAANSLVSGVARNDQTNPGIIELKNGSFVVTDPAWNQNRGAITWGSGTAGVQGEVSAAISLVGSTENDRAGGGSLGGMSQFPYVTELRSGNFLIRSPEWNQGCGAVTWVNGLEGGRGRISADNSLVGGNAFARAGAGGMNALPDGGYWFFSQSSVSLAEGTSASSGLLSAVNTVFGTGYGVPVAYDSPRARLIVGSGTTWTSQGANRVTLFDFTPEISVRADAATINNADLQPSMEDGSDFGGVLPGGAPLTRRFQIANTGKQPLHLMGTPVVQVTGANAADFVVTAQPAAVVQSGGSVDFEIAFTPGGPGQRTAVLSIANDDSDEPVYTFAIQARRWTSIEVDWRNANYFGDVRNTGLMDDYDGDGASNLLEFAFSTIPSSDYNGPGPLLYGGTFAGGGQLKAPGQPVILWETAPGGPDIRALYTRRKDYEAAGLIYTAQFSADLVTWTDSGVTPSVLAENASAQIVSIPYPELEAGKKARFFRLKVELAP